MFWLPTLCALLAAALTGWALTRLGIRLLFRPHQPLSLLNRPVQGFLPGHQQQLARAVGAFASRELISFSSLEQKLTDPSGFEKLKPEIEAHLDHFLQKRIGELFPMLSMFIGEKTTSQLRSAFLQELEQLFPAVMKGYLKKLEADFNPEQLIAEKLAAIPPAKLEASLRQALAPVFSKLQLAGALTGLLCAQVALLLQHLL